MPAFAQERQALQNALSAFARTTDDPTLQKAGLWLIEVIKSGAGVLDRAVSTDITYVETGTPSTGMSALLPRGKPPSALEDHTGRQFKAEARLSVDAAGLIGQIEDALKTADHILSRLAEPQSQTHWADTPRLAAMLQNLLEAGGAADSDFALELIEKELPSLLNSGGISVVEYTKKTAKYFDELPGLGEGKKIEMAAPALIREDGSVLRRGTVWIRS